MTLFRLYKDICRLTNIERIYKSSELKECQMGNRVIISLKSYDDNQADEELKCVSNVYFKLIGSIDERIIKDKIESFDFHTYHKKPKLEVDLNTIISVIYINKYSNCYDAEKMILDILKVLFKTQQTTQNG